MKKIIFLLGVMLSIMGTGYSQVSNYAFSQTTGTYSEITGGTVLASCVGCAEEAYDTNTYLFNLPSPVTFNGFSVSSVLMRLDGSLVLGTTETANATGAIAAATTASGVIAPFSMNLENTTTAGQTFELRWQELADEYVFQWKNVARSAQTTELLNFQIRLNKITGVVNIVYGPMTVAANTTLQPVVGLRGLTNTDYNNRRLTTSVPDASPSWDDTAVGTANNSTVRLTSGSPATVPAAGLTYVYTPSGCFMPSPLTINSIGGTTATAQFTPTNAVPASTYEYFVATTSTAPTAATAATGTVPGGNVLNLTGLTPSTQYYVYLRAICGGTPTAWTTGLTFTTGQLPATIPFTEGFEGTNEWTIINGTQTNKWFIGSNAGSNSLYVSNTAAGTNNEFTITSTSTVHAFRDIAVPAGTTDLVLSFDWQAGGESTFDYIRVWAVPTTYMPVAGTQITAANSGGIIIADVLNLSTGFVSSSFLVNASAYAGQNMRLVFLWRNDSSGGIQPAGSVDNISITSPTCFTPTALQSSLLAGSATISWTAPATAPSGGYDIYVSDVNTAPVTGTTPTVNVTGTSAVLTTLTPDTVYYYWVRSNCGAGNTTLWVNGGSFRTECLAVVPPTAYEQFNDYTGNFPAPCWREAKGTLGATPITLTGTASNWASGNFNNITGGENGTAAYINLDGVDDEWIISPTFNLGSGAVDYQIEYIASVIPFTGTTPVTTMEEKFVKVVVSTDGGLTWSEANVLQTYNSANIPAGEMSATVNLGAYSGNVKIGFYARSVSADGVDLRFYIDNFRIIEVPSCLTPLNPVVSTVGETTATLSWTAPATAPVNGYQYYVNNVNTAPTAGTVATGTVGAGIVTANLASLSAGTDYFVWVRSNCGASLFSEWVGPVDFSTLCDSPDVLTSTATPICGQGTSTLTATVSGGVVKWYSAQTGGTLLATAPTYTTPQLTATTSYWVAASNPGVGIETSGKAVPSTTGTFSSTGYGIVFNATDDVTLQDVSVYSTADGTVNVQIVNAAGVQLFETGNVNVTAGGTTTPNIIPLNFALTAGTGYRMLIKAYSGAVLVRDSSGNTFPYNGSDSVVNVTSGYTGSTSTSYYYFYDLTYVSSCTSARTEVVVNVTAAPTIDATVSDDTTCAGENTNLNVSSANTGYSYVWMPGNLTGAAQTVNPAVTTTYTVTATDAVSGCVTTDEVTVTVNSLPAAVTITNSSTGALCAGQVATLSAGGGTPNPVIGTGTAVNTATGVPSPYSLYYGGNKYQMLVRASELNALGYTTGSQISAIAFNVSAVGASFGGTLENFQIDMGHTADNVLNATAFVTGLTNYLPAGTVTIPTTGLPANVTHTFTTPFVWNGVDNIVVQTSFSNNVAGTSAQTVQMTYSPAGFAATSYYRDDEATAEFVLGFQDPASTSNNRPNMIFTATNPGVVWSPATDLYTDAAATVPYVSGAAASTVYVKSSTAGTTAYTATRTTAQGCSTSATVNIAVNAETPAPAASALTFCSANTTVANLTATGANLQWYAALTGGTALPTTTTVTTGNYYVSQTVNGCESTRTMVSVTVNTIAAPTASSLTFCNASPTVANLTATGTALQWYAASTGGTALAATTPLASGNYYVSQTINGCESPRAEVAVTVNVTAAPTASALTFCNASPTVANLTATGTGLQWYAAVTGGTALAATTAVVSGNYYVSQTINGCESARTEVAVTVNTTAAPTASALTFCNASPTVANLTATGTNLQWYTDLTGGTALAVTTPLVAGNYYVSQTINGCESSRTEVAVTINTTAAPTVTDFTFCNASPTVGDLTATGTALQWYADATGGTALAPATALTAGTYFVSQTINGCESPRASVNVTINTTTAPVAAAAQSFCEGATVADINVTGTATQWYSTQTGDNPIALTTEITNGTIYYVSQIINGCESARTAVTATVITVTAEEIADQVVCSEYVLPALTSGNYFTATNGGGTQLAAGTAIIVDSEIFIFAQTGECTDETSFTVDVTPVDAITGEATQLISVNDLADATIEDLVVTAAGTVIWYPTAADAAAGTNPIAAGTQLVNGENYFAVQTVGTCTSAAFEVTATVALGREDFNLDTIKYYPNPVVDKLTISFSSNITQVEVYNLLGQLVIAQQPNATTAEVNMARLEAATYIVKVTADGKSKTFKVVKNN